MNELKKIVQVLDEKLATNITVIHISEVNPLCEYFVVCTGNNERHMSSLATELRQVSEELGIDLKRIEGLHSDSWILVDLGDIVVHIFSAEGREKYSLEKLWSNLTRIDIEQL